MYYIKTNMLKYKLNRTLPSLLFRKYYGFQTIKPEDYLINQRESSMVKTPHIATLQPLMGANQGDPLVTD